MNLTGRFWGKIVLLTKYGEVEVIGMEQNVMRLTNQLWKLIPMRENEENWKQQLESVILEIIGLQEIFIIDLNLLQLLSKLEGLNNTETSFNLYRKTVFEAINLLQGFAREH